MKTWGIYIIAALGFAVYGAATNVDRDSSGAIIDGGTVGAFDIRVGDCFDDVGASDEISSLPGVPCADPHDNEAYSVFDLTITSYPGDEEVWELANEFCLQEFSAFVGMDYDSSSLGIFTMYPTMESWNRDDREVVCSIYDMNSSKLVGSMKDRAL